MNELTKTIVASLTPETVTFIVAAMMAIAAVTAIYLVASFNIRAMHHRRERVSRAATRAPKKSAAAETLQLRRKAEGGSIDKIFGKILPRPDVLRARLHLTGRKITPGQFVGSILVCGLLCFALIWKAGGLSPTTALIFAIGGGLMIPHFYISYLISKRKNRFLDNLADGVDIMVRGLKAGLPISETVIAVASEAVSPVRDVFADVADRVRMGTPVDQAFVEASRVIDASEMKFLAITLSVQKETGGNLAETLENLSDILRKRRQMKLKVKAVSSEARASAMILGSLPFVMFGILMLVNPGYASELFIDPRGHILLTVGLISMMIGIGVMMKMVRFEI